MYEEEILARVVSRTPEMVEFRFENGIIIRAYIDGKVTRSEMIKGYERVYPIDYKRASFKVNGKSVSIEKSRLIALAFLGLPEQKGMVLIVVDKTKSNMDINNLLWMTHMELICLMRISANIKYFGYEIKRPFTAKDLKELCSLGFNVRTGRIPGGKDILDRAVDLVNGDISLQEIPDSEKPEVVCWDISEEKE